MVEVLISLKYIITSFRAISALRQSVEQKEKETKTFLIVCKAPIPILENVKNSFRLKPRLFSAIQDEVDQFL